MTERPDVLVVGGGVAGLSIAWRIARSGTRVLVLDPAPGKGASWAAAGMLAPVTEAHYGEESLLRLNLASSALYPEFVGELQEETGVDVGYRRSGTVLVARDSDDNEALEHVYRFQRELGLEVERLSGRECRRHEPALSPRTRGGIFVPGDHQIDNRALVRSLLLACERAGVRFDRAEVAELVIDEGSITGVKTNEGDVVSGGVVILAAGARSSSIKGWDAARLPAVRPVKGQLVHLRSETPLLRGNVRGIDAYLVGRADGRVVLGATVEEQGFDLKITAGALHDLLRAAYELLPGITELEVTETAAGSRPTTPDNAPLLGPTSVEHLYVATGHFRNGVLLAPITAHALASTVIEGRVPDSVLPFSPARFAEERFPS